MAAKKSTRALRAGRPIPRPGTSQAPKRLDAAQSGEILAAFDEGIGLIKVTYLAMEARRAQILAAVPDSLAPYASALRQALTLINQAYRQLDRALPALTRKEAGSPTGGASS